VARLFDTSTRQLQDARPHGAATQRTATLYVCGITPYDATHLGHAATYLAYDTLVRLWIDARFDVRYVQNVTDVDDPLLERATATGVDWRELAASQVELFRVDMESLAVIPPDEYVAVTEVIDPIAEAVIRLLDIGVAYWVDGDVYFDSAAAAATSSWELGQESGLGRGTMLVLSAERGGDPDRPGKRDPLDPVLWLGAREGEPSWTTALGEGRPGWHIECSVIAQQQLTLPLTVTGGGHDLVFPHHEFTAGHTAALTGTRHADLYSHAGLVALGGVKMSKSLGNLVLVSELRDRGVDPRAIRLAVITQHYRQDWEWTETKLSAALQRLSSWEAWASMSGELTQSPLTDDLRAALANDLDTPAAIALVDARVMSGLAPSTADLDAIEALLGIRL
jgi:L-cysteine:1D-myo-inositol 2-amino-2-deoxy-alpha-D-glucopyranoside ligase